VGEIYLPLESQQRLLRVSRRCLEDFVHCVERQGEVIDDPYLQSRSFGAFVTLRNGDQFRGCIGTCVPTKPLYETVIDMTEAAASKDHRVEPITASELETVRIDISVLSPLESVIDPLALEAGKHGLYVVRGAKKGVLLPQVATEYKWNIKRFLEQTCIKAGLVKNAWQDHDTTISSFTALIIEERP
jgi:hypothetical protein